jgi:pimeloyl-ACP methyl ester carboxylesterase
VTQKTELTGRDGNRLVADVAGDPAGHPVVLLHGGGQTRHAWGTTLATLASNGWHAYTMDLRGHGESDWVEDGDYSIDAFSGDVATVARSFATPPVLVGASLGGLSSLVAIGEASPDDGPLAAGLVLVDVAPRVEPAGVDRIKDFMNGAPDGFATLEQAADAVAAYNPHRPRPNDLSGLRKNLRQRKDGRWVWHWDPRFIRGPLGSDDETRSSMLRPDRLQQAARNLTVPTLLVRGRMSDLLSEQGAKELLELVPHAEFADVAGAGHMVAGDRNDSFNDAVVSFLERVRSGERSS